MHMAFLIGNIVSPVSAQTRFMTASAGKVFVATAILQHLVASKLTLHTQLGDLLPYDLGLIDRRVTVFQLLTHTSGIGDYFDESVMDNYVDLWIDTPNYRIRRSKDLLPQMIDRPMKDEPGSVFSYNNSGYVLLGLILEELTGQPFDDYLLTSVFSPAKMSKTGYFALDRLPENTAQAYIYDEKTASYYTNIY